MTKKPYADYAETAPAYDSPRSFAESARNNFDPAKPHVYVETKRVIRDGAPINISTDGSGNSIGWFVDQMIQDSLERGEELAEIKLDLTDKWDVIQKAAIGAFKTKR